MTLSIIIPVYNGASYIGRCLDSIVSQTKALPSIEIIVVDDGSIDNTSNVVQRYVDQYQCVSYYYRKNGGVPVARNYGLTQDIGIISNKAMNEQINGMKGTICIEIVK